MAVDRHVEVPAGSATPPAYPIGSVDSALRLLLMFSKHQNVRIADASRELNVARSTAHRMMQMLQYYGFVCQDPESKSYTAGPVWVNMGLRGVRNLDIRTIARPHIEMLVDEIKETTQLVALQPGGEIVCLEALEGPQRLRAAGAVGALLVPYSTAGGRALLAFQRPETLANLYPDEKLQQVGPRTIRTRSALYRQLDLTREQGYAVQRDELEAGVSAIAAPIRDSRGFPNFAIDLVLPTARLRENDIPRIGQAVTRCADRIADELAW